MKESSDCSNKNNYLSSNFLKFKGLYNSPERINGALKENKDTDNNSNQSKQLSETQLRKNISLSLNKFMENQDKKHLSTNFNHKDVKKFLKEKEKAMEEIIIEDESIDDENLNDNEEKEDRSKPKVKDKNKSVNFKEEKNQNKSKDNSSNENNNILIFHGTFGEDKFNEIVKAQNLHKHSHHHHHHHHHHVNENKNNLAFQC